MASPSKKHPDFFVMYLPGIHEDRLRIPRDFVEHFNGSLPEKAILKDSVGRIWRVEIGQVGRSMFFANGWQQFLSEKSVEEGDFFVFHYAGNSIFDVKLLGRDQCEKEGTAEKDVKDTEREAVDEMVEEEEHDDEAEEEEDDDEAEEEEDEEEDYEAEDEEGETVDDETEEEDEEEWEKEDDGAEEEEVDAFSHRSSTRGNPTIERNNCYGCKQSAARTGAVFNETAASSSLALLYPACPLRSYFSENPFFIAKISFQRRHRLHVPSHVLKDHNIILPPEITLIDPLGRSWIGKVRVWKDGRAWIGCRAFCKWNHVSPNDDCIFEFVRESSDQEYHIVIHICGDIA